MVGGYKAGRGREEARDLPSLFLAPLPLSQIGICCRGDVRVETEGGGMREMLSPLFPIPIPSLHPPRREEYGRWRGEE